MTAEEKLKNIESSIDECVNQMKTLTNRHNQLLGYRQCLVDILNELPEVEVVQEEAVTQKSKKAAA